MQSSTRSIISVAHTSVMVLPSYSPSSPSDYLRKVSGTNKNSKNNKQTIGVVVELDFLIAKSPRRFCTYSLAI